MLTEEQKNELLGQAYFFRAYMYYHLVTIYGGVPIIDHVQDPILGTDGDGSDLIVPRQTTKDCVDFICADFERAAKLRDIILDLRTYSVQIKKMLLKH